MTVLTGSWLAVVEPVDSAPAPVLLLPLELLTPLPLVLVELEKPVDLIRLKSAVTEAILYLALLPLLVAVVVGVVNLYFKVTPARVADRAVAVGVLLMEVLFTAHLVEQEILQA
jgi:hypothetical protein